MRHNRFTVSLMVILLLCLTTTSAWATTTTPTAVPPTVTATPANEVIYTVRSGDTLFRIATRFGVTVRQIAEANGITNPALIVTGQQLRIPGVAAATATPVPPTATITVTPIPIATTDYTVQVGDTLFKIAIRFRTTVRQLAQLNNLTNPNLIYVGQRLQVPAEGGATPTAVSSTPLPTSTALPTSSPQPTTAPSTTNAGQGGTTTAGYGFDFGIEAFLVDQDVTALVGDIQTLGMRWVKQTINWRDFEPIQGEIDFATLDGIIDSLNGANLKILLTLTAAPDWARSSAQENGPPDDFATFTTFVSAVTARYAGRVQAYQIWNEPNLRREWNSEVHDISAASYTELLTVAYTAVKSADSAALVLSAGLAPTGYNDGVNAIDDRQFLRDMYANGLAAASDAIGAHPLGWANPPDAECCVPPPGVLTHFENPSFYFRNTLSDYRQIMTDSGDGSTPIWVTKFGWGSSEDTDPPSETYIFVSYTDLVEQAAYVPRAFQLGTELGFIGPMFLDNLNGCDIDGAENCYNSLLGPGDQPRPVFAAVRDLITPTAEIAPQPGASGDVTVEAPPASDIQPGAGAEATHEATPGS